jgi:hypothetical protein
VKMEPEIKTLWTTALKENRWPQARGSFIDADGGDPKTTGHCCLAVLTHLAAEQDVTGIQWGNDEPKVVCRWDHDEVEWKQPATPEEAKGWMDNLPELDPDETDSSHESDGWAWRKVSEMTDGDLPQVIVGWAGVGSTNPLIGGLDELCDAIHLNDSECLEFDEIADRIEQYL